MPTRDKSNDPAAGAPGRPANGPGETAQSREARPEPKLPHERDESASQQGTPPQEPIEQARKDVEKGLADTGKKPVMDAVYERQKRGG